MSGPLNLEQIISFLLDAPMFGDLDASELSEIVHILQVRHLREGQYLFQVGDDGDAWYVSYGGEVDVLVPAADGSVQRLDRLGAPACFGEMAVLDGSRRSASVRAATDATVLRFPRDAFAQLLKEGNLAAYKLVLQMAVQLAARHRQTTRLLVDIVTRIDATVAEDVHPNLRLRRPSE